jgi:hypothetical protein
MYSNMFGKKVILAILVSVLSVTLVIPNFGCCDCYRRRVDPGRFSSYRNRQYFAPDKNTGSSEAPKPITTPESSEKKNITDKGAEEGSSGASGGC